MNMLHRIMCYLMSIVLFITLIAIDLGMYGDAFVLGCTIFFIILPELVSKPVKKQSPFPFPPNAHKGYMNDRDYVEPFNPDDPKQY